MTNGVSRASNKKIGAETGDPRQFTSFEQVREAFAEQVALQRRNTQLGGNRMEQPHYGLCTHRV